MMTSFGGDAEFKPNVVTIEGRGSHHLYGKDSYKQYISNVWLNMRSEVDKSRNESKLYFLTNAYEEVDQSELFDSNETAETSKT